MGEINQEEEEEALVAMGQCSGLTLYHLLFPPQPLRPRHCHSITETRPIMGVKSYQHHEVKSSPAPALAVIPALLCKSDQETRRKASTGSKARKKGGKIRSSRFESDPFFVQEKINGGLGGRAAEGAEMQF